MEERRERAGERGGWGREAREVREEELEESGRTSFSPGTGRRSQGTLYPV